MEVQNEKGTIQYLTITLEIKVAGSDEAEMDDIAFIQGVGHDTVDLLQQCMYDVANVKRDPSTPAMRGAEGFIVLITHEIMNIAHYQDAIEHTINDLGALITILAGVIPAISSMIQALQKRQELVRQLHTPMDVTIEIDNAEMPIDASTANVTDQALLATQLAQQFAAKYPATAVKVTLNSKVKVKGQVTRQAQHKRRRKH